jgi:phosphate starvation-inducible PhoH-like protein
VPVLKSTKAEKREIRKKAQRRTPTETQKPVFTIPKLEPRNRTQVSYIDQLERYPQVFALGPAGCGKTHVATHWAIQQIVDKKFEKLIVTRPMVSSDRNENIGFLPGDLNTKFTPWALPILDTIENLVGKVKTQDFLRRGIIEFAPFQFMRGRTFGDNCIIMLDEAQNCTYEQLKLFVTRLGYCKSIVSGDPSPGQCDIPRSGLAKVVAIAEQYGIEAAVSRFTNVEIVRSKLCRDWVNAFEDQEISLNGATQQTTPKYRVVDGTGIKASA